MEGFPHPGQHFVHLALIAEYGLAESGPQVHFLHRIGTELEQALGEIQPAGQIIPGIPGDFRAFGMVVGIHVHVGHEAGAHDHAAALDLVDGGPGLDQLAVLRHGRLQAIGQGQGVHFGPGREGNEQQHAPDPASLFQYLQLLVKRSHG